LRDYEEATNQEELLRKSKTALLSWLQQEEAAASSNFEIERVGPLRDAIASVNRDPSPDPSASAALTTEFKQTVGACEMRAGEALREWERQVRRMRSSATAASAVLEVRS